MPYIELTHADLHALIISGVSNSGKSQSLRTFLYGPYDYHEQHDEAMEYLSSNKYKSMIVISCPGEKGFRSLLRTPQIKNYVFVFDKDEDIMQAQWSRQALDDFNKIAKEAIKARPDVLVLDGFHHLWKQLMNRLTDGLYLRGESMESATNKYQIANWHDRTHNAFANYIDYFYSAPVPLFIATVWEDWQAGTSESQAGKQVSISAERYLWPAIPGKMALAAQGHFDARISARKSKICLHADCVDAKEYKEHFCWQFSSQGDVQGVEIKGLRLNAAMKKTPFIHQNYDDLKALVEAFS